MSRTNFKLWWSYENQAVKDIGSFPPEPLNLIESKMAPDSPYRLKDRERIDQTLRDTNYKTQPNDCGPYRLISSYGFVARAPADIIIECSENNEVNISSVKWPYSENGYIAVPIANSEYLKINTGIMM